MLVEYNLPTSDWSAVHTISKKI